jgi:tetratricopeptide (TPR) repeat protein
MAKKSGRISLFWQELKRRKVIKAATMYAASAFIIIEASDIVLPRLGLPDWTVTFLIILLIVGFPIALILSWIFDVTPQGMEKTEAITEETLSDAPPLKKPLFSISNLIIAGLLIVVCILLYPRIFNKDQFEEIRDEKGRISVAVMPFENITGDSLNNIWQGGIQNLLISALSNSDELQVRRYQTTNSVVGHRKNINQASVSPALAREVARDMETKTFILGKIMQAGNRIRINAQLLNAETEEIYKTYQVDCLAEEDLFAASDSLGIMIRNYLEIKKFSESAHSSGALSLGSTNSPEAFGYYIKAYDRMEKMDARSTIDLLQKAIESDPEFIDAYVFLSLYLTSIQEYQAAEEVLNRIYDKRDQVSANEQLLLDHLYAHHHGSPHKEIMYCRQIIELDELNTPFWFFLGYAHSKLEQYEEAIEAFDQIIEINRKWGINISIPQLYHFLGDALHQVGDHKRENEIWELGLKVYPNYGYLIRQQSVCALSQGNRDKAAEYLQKYRTVRKAEGWTEAGILHGIGYIYDHAGLIDEAEKFMRQAYALDPDDPQVLEGLAWIMIEYDRNIQEGMRYIEKAVKLNPDAYNIVDTWGWGLYKSGRYEEALEALHKARELRNIYDLLILRHIQAAEKALATIS